MNPESEVKAEQRGGYSRNALHERGWTDTMIDKILGWPDTEQQNPYYELGTPIARVRWAEGRDEFRTLQAKRRRPRKEVAA
jgi:hypothetical protein